jgi:quinol monooxygenase YgiN
MIECQLLGVDLPLMINQSVTIKCNMAKFVEMDEQVTLSKQMEEETGPIVFMNKFSMNPDDVDEFLKRWAADAAVFKKQPGFISAQLHRGIASSGTFVNYAIWESAAHLKDNAIQQLILEKIIRYPSFTKRITNIQ